MTTKRPHVEHDWKDRSLKLMEQKKEMQQRIDNLSNEFDEEVCQSKRKSDFIVQLHEEGIANARYTVKIGVLLLISVALNVGLAMLAVWMVNNV